MGLNYKMITIFSGEDVKWQAKPLYQAIIEYISGLEISARCIVSKGIAGSYENGEIVTLAFRKFSLNMPVKVEIMLPAKKVKLILPTLEKMVTDGIVAVAKLTVHSFKSSTCLIQYQLKVYDVMTVTVEAVTTTTTVEEVVRKMLTMSLKSVPVVDERGRVQGIITQNNLITCLPMPMRLGLLARLEQTKVEVYLNKLPLFSAREIMSHPVVTIKESQYLYEAIQLMLEHNLKRIPVVNEECILTGMLSRIDIFRIITKQIPMRQTLKEQKVIAGVKNRETEIVFPETPLSEVIEVMYNKEIQRLAVVDRNKRLLGIISDYDLLPLLNNQPTEAGGYFI